MTITALTPRQTDILRRIALGHTHRRIARDLCISPHTVEAHRAAIGLAIGTRRTSDLTRYAVACGLLTPAPMPARGR